MNRKHTVLLALASIFFLFGSLVTAQVGTVTSQVGLTTTTVLTAEEKEALKEMKEKLKFKIESDDDIKERMEVRAMSIKKVKLEIKNVENAPAWVSDDSDVWAAFGLDDATLKKIESLSAADREKVLSQLRIRYEEKMNSDGSTELRLRMKAVEDRAKEVADAHKLDGVAKFKARLEVAIKMAEANGNTELVAKLNALLERLQNKTVISDADKKDVDDSIFEHRKNDFTEKAPKVIQLAGRVNNRLSDFITRLEALIASRNAEGLNTGRLEAGVKKLSKDEERLAAQIKLTESDWAAYEDKPSRDTLKAVHYDLVKLKVLARHAMHDMKVMVRYYRHFVENNGADDDSYAEYEAELEVEDESDADAEAASVVGAVDAAVAADAAITADDNPSADDLSDETDDSGADGEGDDDGTDDQGSGDE